MHVITIPKSSNTASSTPADTTVTRMLLADGVNVDKGSSIVEKVIIKIPVTLSKHVYLLLTVPLAVTTTIH